MPSRSSSIDPSSAFGLRTAFAKVALRWLARAGSVVVVGVLALFAFGENRAWPTLSEWLLLAFFPFGVVVGLLIAWWREVRGACISLASLLGFFGLIAYARGSLPPNPWLFALFASPAPLFLLAGALKEHRPAR
jgi:hypothetical protein